MAIMCRDDQGRIWFQSGRSNGDFATLVTEALAIREAITQAIKAKSRNIIIQSDSKSAI